MKKKVVDNGEQISTMDALYKEVEIYSSSEHVKQRKGKKISAIIWNVVFIVVFCILMYGVVVVNMVKESGSVPFIFGYSLQYIQTGSMEKTLPVGSIILTKKINDNTTINAAYNTGDIITFYNQERTIVTHRAVETYTENNVMYFKTKGDANNSLDSMPIPRYDVISIFIRRIA